MAKPKRQRVSEHGTGRLAALSRKVTAAREELGDSRRGSVYKTDAELFTGTEITRRKLLPRRGSEERAQLDEKILQMLRAGKTQAVTAGLLNITTVYVSQKARENGLGRGQR